MIVGVPKRTLLALPRVIRRVAQTEPLDTRHEEPRIGLFAAFTRMMEKQAELMMRGLGD